MTLVESEACELLSMAASNTMTLSEAFRLTEGSVHWWSMIESPAWQLAMRALPQPWDPHCAEPYCYAEAEARIRCGEFSEDRR